MTNDGNEREIRRRRKIKNSCQDLREEIWWRRKVFIVQRSFFMCQTISTEYVWQHDPERR